MAPDTRSISVKLSLQDNYSAAIRAAGKATDDFAARGERAGKSASGAKTGLGELTAGAVGLDTKMLGLAGGVAFAGKTFMDFEKAMSGVRANVDATPAQFDQLTASVKAAGAQYGFTATESAGATEELAKAGLTASQIIGGGLSGALTLAAAGGVSTSRAAEVAATSMTMFGKKASDVGHIADVLANGANTSTASIDSLAMGLQQGGMSAAQMGLSLEDTVATLAAFDQAGLKGSDAGTSLKTMLTALANPSKEAAATMQELGINAFDASGKFIGMQGLADQLSKKMAGLSDQERAAALSTIFGSDAARAASVTMGLASDAAGKGGKSFTDWAAAMGKTGMTAENARTRTDNLAGDLKKLASEAQNAIISLGQGGSGPAREFVQLLTGLLGVARDVAGALGSIPGPVAGVATALGLGALASRKFGDSLNIAGRVQAFSGALSSLSRSSTTVVTSADGMRRALDGIPGVLARVGGSGSTLERMGVSFATAASQAERFPRAAGLASAASAGLKGAASGLLGVMGGPLGLAIAGAGVGLGILAQRHQEAANKAAAQKSFEEQLASTLDKTTGAATQATRAAVAQKLEQDGLLAQAQKYHVSLGDVTDVVLGMPGALDRVNGSLNAQQKAFGDTNTVVTAGGNEYRKTDFELKKFQESLNGQAGSAKRAAEANKRVADASKETGRAAAAAKSGVDKLAEAEKKASEEAATFNGQLMKVQNTFLALSGSEIGVQQSIADATQAFRENGRSVDISTEAGRKNVTALNAVAAAMQQNLSNMRANGAGAAEIAAQTSKYRAELEKLGRQAGLSGQKLQDFVAEGLKLPSNLKTTISAETTQAQAALDKVDSKLKSVNGQTLTIKAKDLPQNIQNDLLKIADARRHAGGTITITANENNVTEMRYALKDLKDKAVLANGTIVSIPASVPNAAMVKSLIEQIDAAAVTADSKSVTITSSAPMAASTVSKIKGIEGVTVSADSKSVTISTDAPNAGNTIAKINAVLSAARDKSFTITTYYQSVDRPGVTLGPTKPSASVSNGMAAIGRATGGAVFGAGTETSDSIPAWLSHNEHVLTAKDVRNLGGHAAVYALRDMAARGFRVPGFAAGGAVRKYASGGAIDDWTPDMSGIMAYAASLKVDPSALADERKKIPELTSKLDKAVRDLKAARAGLVGKSGAARIKAENRVADALERQAKAQRELNDGKTRLAQMEAGAKTDTTGRFLMATGSQNGVTKRFLDNIERIRRRGFPNLARTLLEQGDTDAQAIAQTLSGGAMSRLKEADSGLKASDSLADRKQKLLDDLKGVGSASPSAQQEANRQLIALRAANNRQAFTGGVVKVSMPTVDQLADAVAKRIDVHMPTHLTVQSNIDGREVGRTTTRYQDAAAMQGSGVFPGLRF